MNILDDIEIVNIPEKAKEIKEKKLGEIEQHIEFGRSLLSTTPSEDMAEKLSHIQIINFWVGKRNKILQATM